MGIKVEAAAYNSIGGRKNNEDSFYLNGVYLEPGKMDRGGKVGMSNEQPLQVYGVFDGMGGGEYGEFASYCAASRLRKYQEEDAHVDHAENLRRFLTDTSREIDRFSEARGLRSGACGSTAAMLIIGDWWYRTAHVGDSRIYLLRNNELSRLTKDQSEVQRMVDSGQITPEEAWDHPRKNVITHHLGMPLKTNELQSVISERMPLNEGDCLLICSDGVSDSLRDSEIFECFDLGQSAEENAARIVKRAKQSADQRGIESDNITAVVLKVEQVADSSVAEKRVKWLKTKQKLCVGLGALCALGALGALVRLLLLFR